MSGLEHVEAHLNGTFVQPGDVVALPLGDSILKFYAWDVAGRSTHPSYTLHSLFDFSGFASPQEGQAFEAGEPAPVHYAIADGCAPEQPVADAVGTLWLSQNGGEEIPATSLIQAGNTAVYDPELQQYIYDLDTTDLSPGTWQIRLHLNDETDDFVSIVVQ